MLGLIKSLFTGKVPIVGDIIGGISDHFKHKRDLKRAIELAKIERINKLDTNDVEWDQIMAKNSDGSWKDEWFTIILSIPAILAFIPSMAGYVLEGFSVLNEVPDWYKVAFGTAVAAAFGRNELIKWFSRPKNQK